MCEQQEIKKRIIGILEVIAAYPHRHNFDRQDAEICTAGIDLIGNLDLHGEASREFVVELPEDWHFEKDDNAYYQSIVVGGQQMRALCKAAIEAAGGRVK